MYDHSHASTPLLSISSPRSTYRTHPDLGKNDRLRQVVGENEGWGVVCAYSQSNGSGAGYSGGLLLV